jgi:hypothetical protein
MGGSNPVDIQIVSLLHPNALPSTPYDILVVEIVKSEMIVVPS